jgi:hypothetical protein
MPTVVLGATKMPDGSWQLPAPKFTPVTVPLGLVEAPRQH